MLDALAHSWRKSLSHTRTKQARKCQTCAISQLIWGMVAAAGNEIARSVGQGRRLMSDMGDLFLCRVVQPQCRRGLSAAGTGATVRSGPKTATSRLPRAS